MCQYRLDKASSVFFHDEDVYSEEHANDHGFHAALRLMEAAHSELEALACSVPVLYQVSRMEVSHSPYERRQVFAILAVCC